MADRGHGDGSKRTQWKPGQSGNASGVKSKLTLREVAEKHGMETDPTDPQQRSRFRRVLDRIYARALDDKLTSQKAAEEYCARVAGKPITPVDVTGTVTHQSTEQHVESILEMIAAKQAKALDQVN